MIREKYNHKDTKAQRTTKKRTMKKRTLMTQILLIFTDKKNCDNLLNPSNPCSKIS